MNGPRNRIVNSYVDNAFLNVSNPNSLFVTNTLFLNSHSIWNTDSGSVHVSHIHYRDNMYVFYGPDPHYGPQKYNQTSIELRGDFNAVHTSDVIVEDESHVPQGAAVGTVVRTTTRASLSQTNATVWRFNVTAMGLLFPWIDEVLYSVSTDDGVVSHIVHDYSEDPPPHPTPSPVDTPPPADTRLNYPWPPPPSGTRLLHDCTTMSNTGRATCILSPHPSNTSHSAVDDAMARTCRRHEQVTCIIRRWSLRRLGRYQARFLSWCARVSRRTRHLGHEWDRICLYSATSKQWDGGWTHYFIGLKRWDELAVNAC